MTVVEQLQAAIDAHDLEAIVASFDDDYVNETPAHPARGFRGRAQVRRNWEQILAFVPDVRAEILRTASDGEAIWSEWAMHGTRRDGQRHEMRGVIVFGVRGAKITWARFYLEPLDDSGGSVDDAVRQVTR